MRFPKPDQQVCPPIAYLSIINPHKLGNCVCKWVVRCLTTDGCTCGYVITRFAFINAHFLKQPSSQPYFSVTSLPPTYTHPGVWPRCVSYVCCTALGEGPSCVPLHIPMATTPPNKGRVSSSGPLLPPHWCLSPLPARNNTAGKGHGEVASLLPGQPGRP